MEAPAARSVEAPAAGAGSMEVPLTTCVRMRSMEATPSTGCCTYLPPPPELRTPPSWLKPHRRRTRRSSLPCRRALNPQPLLLCRSPELEREGRRGPGP